MCESRGILYEGIVNDFFEGSIKTTVFLENSHRFNENPEFGALLRRVWKGEVTAKHIEVLNTRVL